MAGHRPSRQAQTKTFAIFIAKRSSPKQCVCIIVNLFLRQCVFRDAPAMQ